MRSFVLLATLAAAAPALAADSTSPRANPSMDKREIINPNGLTSSLCPPTSRYEAARRGGKLGPSLLNQLPAADMYKAVYRRVDGCEAPIIVRYDVGGSTQSGR
jgi:hypothetical protein